MTADIRRAALVRHPATPCVAVGGIEVEARREAGLALHFRLAGDTAALRVPDPVPPAATDRLWEHTCFEAFVRAGAGPGYVEFNFSPSGEWARYVFAAYRERIDAPVVALPPSRVTRRADALELAITLPPAALPPLEAGFSLALSTVVEAADGSVSYWALRHAPGRPDFHHAEAFAWRFDAP